MVANGGVGLNAQQVYGYYETMKALKALDPAAARRIDRAINKAADVVAQSARSLVVNDVLSGFARSLPGGKSGSRRQAYGGGYDDPIVRGGIKVKRNRQRKRGNELRSFVVVANTSPLGAIWEVAGRSSAGNPPGRGWPNRAGNGRGMIEAITRRDGKASRTVWRAAEQTDMGHVQQVIAEQIDEARRMVQSKIDKA